MDIPTSLLRGDSRKESIFQKINEIIQYLNASRLCADGQSLRMDRTSSGTILSALRQVTPPPSSGEGYSGYFRVDLVEESGVVTISVLDGSDETFPIAGCAYYKGVKVDCPKMTDIEIAAGFLCLYIQDQGDGTYEADYEIKTDIPAAPVADDGTAWYPLAEIIGPDEDGGWYTRQIHQGGIPGAAAGQSGYAGSFKVINDGANIKVVNGASSDSLFCGRTDIKGYILVQEFSLESAKGKKVFIIGLSNGTSYSVVIYLEGNEPSDKYKSDPTQLATVDTDGKVTQDWTDGDIKFSEDYFV